MRTSPYDDGFFVRDPWECAMGMTRTVPIMPPSMEREQRGKAQPR